jgi:hypothetical protein
MKVGDLSTSTAKLRLATDGLQRAWLEALEEWNDPAARRYEHDYLDPLVPVIKAAMEAMNQLAVIFSEAERALEQ